MPSLLVANGRSDLAPRIHDYVRQYWAVFEHGKVRVVGNFVCQSELVDIWFENETEDLKPMPRKLLAGVPFMIDDAGNCNVTASLSVDRLEDVTFD